MKTPGEIINNILEEQMKGNIKLIPLPKVSDEDRYIFRYDAEICIPLSNLDNEKRLKEELIMTTTKAISDLKEYLEQVKEL